MNLSILLDAAPQAQGGGGMSFLFMILLMFVIMWFFLIRPQQKRQKEIRNFQNSLQEGSKVVIGGGISGTVKRIDLATGKIDVEIARGVVVEVDKSYVFADAAAAQTTAQQK